MINLRMGTTGRIRITYAHMCQNIMSNCSGVKHPGCYHINSWSLNYRVNLTHRNVLSCVQLFFVNIFK